MKQFYFFTFLISSAIIRLSAQNIETFEDETSGTKTFTSNGQSFTIESGVNENFAIVQYSGFGWNGGSNAMDNVFIDNGANNTNKDGSSFRIKTTDGTDIYVHSFYLFLGSNSETFTTSETLKIEGKRDGNSIYTLTKTTGFTAEWIANGFTFINLATEGGTDNSAVKVDELVISTISNADYLAFDYLIWSYPVLSVSEIEGTITSLKVISNPSANYVQLYGLNSVYNFKIFDTLGKEIKNGRIANQEKLDIRDFKSGLYFLKLADGNTFKFVKE